MLRKFVLCTGCLLLVSLIACSDSDKLTGGTVDPNTVAENSSSSEADSLDVVSSSSESGDKGVSSSDSSKTENGLNVPISSSSSENDGKIVTDPQVDLSSSSEMTRQSSSSFDDSDGNGHFVKDPLSSSSGYRNQLVKTDDFLLQCKEDSGSDFPPPSAYFSVYKDVEGISLENVHFDVPCDKEQRKEFLNSINEGGAAVGLDGDTLYVAFSRSKGMDYGCSCVADVSFSLDKYYPDVNYTVFDQRDTVPLYEKHYTAVEDIEAHN